MSSPPHIAALSPKHFLSLPRPSVTSSFKDGDYLEADLTATSISASSSSSSPRQAQRLSSVSTVDTSTLAAHDFDVDERTGFMPPCAPLARLPSQWDDWEVLLDDARRKMLQLGGKKGLTKQEMRASEEWRESVRQIPIISIEGLTSSEELLRRAHHVLGWVMHFFINTLPLTAPIIIPPPISIPIIQVSEQLALPPILTYSDDVLYNWTYKDGAITSKIIDRLEEKNVTDFDPLIPRFEALSTESSYPIPKVNQITPLTTFTDTISEKAFYLASSHSELTGALSLQYMSHILDEAFILDILALRRISHHLSLLADNIDAIREELNKVKEDCDPDTFFWEIRPWFKGCDSMDGGRVWVFDGVGEEYAESLGEYCVSEEKSEEYRRMRQPRLDELSGPSAAQSSLIHVIDIFLGVEKFSHRQTSDGASAFTSDKSSSGGGDTFLKRMQTYMPRHHRLFLSHLSTKTPHVPIRTLIETQHPLHPELGLRENYNKAVESLKRFRDAHLKIVALYIVGPARRAPAGEGKRVEERVKAVGGGVNAGLREVSDESTVESFSEESALERKKEKAKKDVLKGTGGTNLVPFLKGVRDLTASAVLP